MENFIVSKEYKEACLALLKETDYATLPDVQLVLTNKADIITFRNIIRNEMLGLSTLYGQDSTLLPIVPQAVWEKLPA